MGVGVLTSGQGMQHPVACNLPRHVFAESGAAAQQPQRRTADALCWPVCPECACCVIGLELSPGAAHMQARQE
jgi:hypothetical protein